MNKIMNKYLFLWKVKESDDRDAVAYIDVNENWLRTCGPCYSGEPSYFFKDVKYDELKTVITEEMFNKIMSEKMTEEDLAQLVETLKSDANQKLFEEIIEEEKEYLVNNTGLTREDVDYVFDNYGIDYQDRGIVGCVYRDYEELGEEEAFSLGLFSGQENWIKGVMERHFDYEGFGEELCDNDTYLECPSGYIVSLSY